MRLFNPQKLISKLYNKIRDILDGQDKMREEMQAMEKRILQAISYDNMPIILPNGKEQYPEQPTITLYGATPMPITWEEKQPDYEYQVSAYGPPQYPLNTCEMTTIQRTRDGDDGKS